MTRRARRAGALAALGALLASTTACGARWSDEERAAVLARGRGVAGTGSDASVGGDLQAGGTGLGEVGEVDAATSAQGPGSASGASTQTGGSGGGGPVPCSAPSDAPGVSDDEIRIGSIASLSGPSPGLGASSAAATRAYVAFRNATGGICGRKVVLQEADDGTEAGRYRAIVTGMADQVLGLAGGFALGDVGALDLISELGLPIVTSPSDDRGTALPSYFDINPPYRARDVVIGKYRYLYEQGVRTATQVYLAVTQSRVEARRQADLMRAAGIEIVDVQELPLSTLSYDAPARRAVNSGADYVFFIGDSRANGAMARAMHDAGPAPPFEEYFTFAYGEHFIALAGDAAAEGATTWLWSLPTEEADGNAEVAHYVEWMERTSPGTPRDPFAADAWASTKALLDNLHALPGPITRAALVAQLRSVGTYDADGMRGPIRLGEELNEGCTVGMRVRDGRWQRMAPDRGFLC